MKTFCLLRLEYGANKVIFTTTAETITGAVNQFNSALTGVQLDKDGYAKLNDTVSFCVAEQWEPLYSV